MSEVKTGKTDHDDWLPFPYNDAICRHQQLNKEMAAMRNEDLVAELKLKLFCWRIYGIGMTIVVGVLAFLL